VIDGAWRADPYNPHQQRNDYGEPNSIVLVDDVPNDKAGAEIVTAPHRERAFHVGALRAAP
jgi:hypothetical protein